MNGLDLSKKKLDTVLKKSRVHLYKPIQIAEILYKHRVGDLDHLADLESYRSVSKRWRDQVSIRFVGRTSTSSAKYQDDIFNQIEPQYIDMLGEYNKKNNGVVEYYIYTFLREKLNQLDNAIKLCDPQNYSDFYVSDFIESFDAEAGLKRSLDKVFEIIIYALFETLTKYLSVFVSISYPAGKVNIFDEFHDFYEDIIGLSRDASASVIPASFKRVGVTNAADRGLDIYANFGSIVQIKHMTLDSKLAHDVVSSINSDKIIIVCKDAEMATIKTILNQIGWGHRVQTIITFNQVVDWYDRVMRGKHSVNIGSLVLSAVKEELELEFPMLGLSSEFDEFCKTRGYLSLNKSDYPKWFTE